MQYLKLPHHYRVWPGPVLTQGSLASHGLICRYGLTSHDLCLADDALIKYM